ncbi:MAG TPA: hypothetical protein VFX67_01870 [Burkholderiales bacterium]|nr:hypothetical protein [Burkholderiales bacterium]
MAEPEGGNQGEGNREADRQFREAQTKFVQSERGKQKIAEAGEVSEEEAKELREAEKKAKSHSKGEDPQVRNQSGGSAGGAKQKP